jgi:hypothetical protein
VLSCSTLSGPDDPVQIKGNLHLDGAARVTDIMSRHSLDEVASEITQVLRRLSFSFFDNECFLIYRQRTEYT